MSPKISVVLCAYNAENYIEEALKSVSNQTFRDFELVIVDDGSTDQTAEIIEMFIRKCDFHTTFIRQENIGLTKSLNKAIAVSKGEYIARMDADDISETDRFEKSLAFIEKGKLDFISTKSKRFFNDSTYSAVPNIGKNLTQINRKLLMFGNPFVHGTFFLKREVFNKYSYNEHFRTAQDFDLLCQLSQDPNIKMGYLNEALYNLRIDMNSSGRSINSAQVNNAQSIARLYFGTDNYMLIKYSGVTRILLSIYKRFFL